MKKIVLLISMMMLLHTSFSQVWMQNLSEENRDNPSFRDAQNAFNNYIEENNSIDVHSDKQFKRTQLFMESRMDENGYLPGHTYWQEAKSASEDFSRFERYGNWEPLGPFVTPMNLQFSRKGGSGRIDCITFHPTDPDIFYVGTPSGGCWKTEDGGDSWECLTDHLPTIGVSDIVIDPTNTDILYLATGTRDTWWETFSVGILKSTNGGIDWEETSLAFELKFNRHVTEIIMNPDDPNMMLASTSIGIYKTINGWNDWSLVQAGNFRELAIKPGDFSVIYGTTFSYTGPSYFYKSTDYGDDFNVISMGFPGSDVSRITLSTTQANPDVLYAIAADKTDQGFYGVFKSDDCGETWNHVSENCPYNLLGWAAGGNDYGGQGYYDLSLAVSPSNEDVLYTGGVNIYKSTDGGVSYDLHAHWLGQGGTDYVHADIHTLTFNEVNSTLYVGCDGGIYELTSNGEDYIDLSDGLEIYQAYRLGLHEPDDELALISPQDNGTTLFEGEEFSEIVLAEACDNFFNDEDPDNIYYGGYGTGLVRSYNRGESHQSIQPPGENKAWFLPPFEKHPTDPQIIYGAYTDAWISYQQGTGWENLTNGLSGGYHFSNMKIAPSNPDYIYLTTNYNIWKTTNNGEEWKNIHQGLPSGIQITNIAISSNDPEHIWVTLGGFYDGYKVYKSTDGGDTYENISLNLPNLPVNCVVYENNTEDAVYIGNDAGIYYINNELDEWVFYSDGLPNVIVLELEINYTANKIKAATYGRGLWEADLFSPHVGLPKLSVSKEIKVYPNPSKGFFTIEFDVQGGQNISIAVSSPDNQLVYKNSFESKRDNNKHFMDLSNLSKGVYLLQISSGNDCIMEKLMIQ